MKDLFKPFSCGNLILKNRFVRSATHEAMASAEGAPTDSLTARYAELAAGGVGAIITGFAAIHADGSATERMIMADRDGFSAEWHPLVKTVHASGAKMLLQLVHAGSNASRSEQPRRYFGPSAVENPSTRITPVEMSEADLERTTRQFADAAMRAQEAGFDGIELHAAHGYLLSQFLTPFFNRRHDRYGGSLENRARFLLEVVKAIRATTGSGFAIWVKINCDDFMQSSGMTEAEGLAVAGMLERAGADLIEVSGGNPLSRKGEGTCRDTTGPSGSESWFARQASAIADSIHIPVALVGGNRRVDALQALADGTGISLFALSRPLICEPALIRRWESGNREPARCVSCNECFKIPLGQCVFGK